MNILVCVKQVPDIDQIGVSEDTGGGAILEEFTEFRMNRFDEFAVEEALRIKEADLFQTPVYIDALTVGPPRAQEAVRRALGMGAQNGFHLKTNSDAYLSPTVIAAGIARYAADKSYALILTGSMSEDGMHAQVGPLLAGHLKRPCAIQAVHLEVAEDMGSVLIEKEVEGGVRERLRLKLPAVVTVQSGINRPRYPSLSNLLRANARDLDTIELAALGPAPMHAAFMGAVLPRRIRAGRVLSGTPVEKAETLVALLKGRALLN